MDAVTLDLTPRRRSEIPSDGAIISAAKSLIEDSLSWKLGKVYQNGFVQAAHAVLPDNSSWHSRVSRHTLPFDQFWAVLGHQWMPAKKAFNEKYIHEIKKVTLVKKLSQTASIWTILYRFPPPMSSRVFTILQVTHLDTSEPRTGWVVHLPIDLTGPGDEALLALEESGIKGRYTCVEQITELPDGRTEWRLVTSSTPAGSIPKSLAEKTLPARISLDVTSFIDWYYTCYLKPKTIEKDTTQGGLGYSLATVGCSLAVLNVIVYVMLYRTALAPIFPARTALAAIWGPGLYALYKSRMERDAKDIVPKTDRLLIGMRDPMIPATIELGEPLPLANATALISARLLIIPRMSHRLVVPTSGAPYWEPCEKVNLTAHVREHTLPSGSGYAELRALLEQLSRTPVDPARPPWDVSIIHRPENGSVLFTRVHHAITDGRGVTDILMACSDETRAALMPPPSSPAPPAPNLFSQLAQIARNIKDLRNLDRPTEPLSSIKRVEPLEAAAMAWMQRPLGLTNLKRLAQRLGGGTVNDLVLAAVAGALRTYMYAHGDDVDKMSIHCKLPVDVFTPSAQVADVVLGTHLGDLNVPLPTNLATADARFAQVCATMQQAKAGYRSGLAATMSGVVGGLATPTRLKLIATDAKTVSCYVSNMKGPPAPMHLAGGIPIANVRCHPLGLNNIGVGFAVYSYNGQVNVAICTDKHLIPDPDVLCRYLEDELFQLDTTSRIHFRRAGVTFLPQSPRFTSVHSVDLACPIEAATPVLLPADSPAIARFLVGTRDSSLKLAADYIHHSTDYVRLDVPSAFSADALPLVSALESVENNDMDGALQRDCFTVVERLPMLFGLVHQTVTVKSWQVLDLSRRVSVYESVVQGAGVRVWKTRELVDLGVDGNGTRRTRVAETLKGICPWLLQTVVKKDSAATHRAAMEKYAAMAATSWTAVDIH